MKPIDTISLFPLLDQKLLDLLRTLTPDEWEKTAIGNWRVKEVAAHLLDGNLRTLSQSRDQYFGDPPDVLGNEQALVQYLNQLNADWVQAMKRVSPALLITLLQSTGESFYRHLTSLDPQASALYPVTWAGQDESPNWFHIAREYTEKWHHQQQIREATGKPGIMTQELYYPVLDTFMQALPYFYRHETAPAGTVVQVVITGEGGGSWQIIRQEEWALTNTLTPASAVVTIDGTVAWRLFTSRHRRNLLPHIRFEGEEELGRVILDMITVMA